ncbi:MAG: purine-nucleoside phosphorylase [Planctomycetota bacterium]|jgi:purine-nucleoside phosphorylase|nr:purine-nucleoside phosphorylase [Planctomycetota bacterium]
MPETLWDRINAAANHIKSRSKVAPRVGIILGTGLGGLGSRMNDAEGIPYADIPGFVTSTVKSHSGQLLLGKLSGVETLVMEGRFHFYEGYSLEQVTFPVRVMAALGAKTLVVTNACGALNPLHNKGDLLIIDDHINLMGVNPLVGAHDDRLGQRFPDMAEPYTRYLVELAETVALEQGIRHHRGVYAAMTGPSLETRAEYRMLRTLGADAIGMSTVPEVSVAVQAGLKVLGLSILTDLCLPDALKPCKIEEIVAVAAAAGPKLEILILEFLKLAADLDIL